MINDQTQLMINTIHAKKYLLMAKGLVAEIVRYSEVKITDKIVKDSVDVLYKECAEIKELLEKIDDNNYIKLVY